MASGTLYTVRISELFQAICIETENRFKKVKYIYMT